MQQVIEQLKATAFLPVVNLEQPERDAVNLAKALIEGGIPAAEITFRTGAADRAIRLMLEHDPEMLVGAGTVLTIEQATLAIDAGAKFLVSPGFDEAVVDYALERNIPIFPGVLTPTEILSCIRKGLDVLKFFPASSYGGAATIKALSAPFPQIRFMPTGGVTVKNLGDYLSLDSVIACGGSFMVSSDLIAAGNWEEISRLTRETRKAIEPYRQSK